MEVENSKFVEDDGSEVGGHQASAIMSLSYVQYTQSANEPLSEGKRVVKA